ncbi:MAG: nucleotide-binding protein [Alphaproteobacteria bacterium]
MLTLYANLKGGTGKSTVVFNMAMWRVAQGKSVTVCDLDPQRTVSDVAMIREEDGIDPPLKVVRELPAKGKARGDWLIDVGTSDMDAVRAAIRACGQIIIPVTPSQADIWATQRFLEIIKEERGKGKMPKIKAFINRADTHQFARENAETLEALQSLPKVEALDAMMMQRVAFRRSFSEGLAVFEMEPSGKAAAELNVLAKAIYGAD